MKICKETPTPIIKKVFDVRKFKENTAQNKRACVCVPFPLVVSTGAFPGDVQSPLQQRNCN